MNLMKPTFLVLGVLAAICAVFAFQMGSGNPGNPVFAKAQTKTMSDVEPVLVELFTSQGCSSCPPADSLAGKLAERRDLVVLSRPVTYWDRLGWPDTLAREDNTKLQRAYARREMVNSGVYTPQMVIDGRSSDVGSREAAISKLIEARKGAAEHVMLQTQHLDNGKLKISVTGAPTKGMVLKLISFSPKETVKVGGGENGGRVITYHNVVKDERITMFSADQASLTVPLARDKSGERKAIVVQQGIDGAVLAAEYL